MRSTESRFVIGPFAGVYVCTFLPGNFTGWGSEEVKVIPHSKAAGIIIVDFNYKRDLDLGHDIGKDTAGESVVQNKSTRSRKPKLSTMERGHQVNG